MQVELCIVYMKTTQSKSLFKKAAAKIPGGVNSPVRAFKAVGGEPIFIQKAKGAYLTDVDGNRYIDYIGSWGPMILGHAHPEVERTIQKTLKNGTSFGAPTALEVQMAEMVCSIVPSVEKVRLVNSGTEAVMGAVRVARGYTKRTKVIKFDGCYHGHADYLLVKAGSGAATLGAPDSAGVPESFAAETLVARLNDIASVEILAEKHRGQIAAVIIEPIVGNMGVILPQKNFLQDLRALCDREEIVLIFDEVMTGFRVALGGAQSLFKVRPDLTTMGKVIGGGLPVGAYGGKKEIMDMVAPLGPVYQAGTLSGNPLAMAAGLTTLKLLKNKKPYKALEKYGKALAQGLREAAKKAGVAVFVAQLGSMITVFFTDREIHNADDARTSDTAKFSTFFSSMLSQGVYLPPSQFESWFISAAHGKSELEKTLRAADAAFRTISRG
jgi:glutamate-1-semialdehyde 2,1-aminomutase